MPKLIVTREWRGAKATFAPGEYEIPAQVDMLTAKCCRADDAGFIQLPSREAPAVTTAKSFSHAPENKAKVASGRGGSKRSQPVKGNLRKPS